MDQQHSALLRRLSAADHALVAHAVHTKRLAAAQAEVRAAVRGLEAVSAETDDPDGLWSELSGTLDDLDGGSAEAPESLQDAELRLADAHDVYDAIAAVRLQPQAELEAQRGEVLDALQAHVVTVDAVGAAALLDLASERAGLVEEHADLEAAARAATDAMAAFRMAEEALVRARSVAADRHVEEQSAVDAVRESALLAESDRLLAEADVVLPAFGDRLAVLGLRDVEGRTGGRVAPEGALARWQAISWLPGRVRDSIEDSLAAVRHVLFELDAAAEVLRLRREAIDARAARIDVLRAEIVCGLADADADVSAGRVLDEAR